VINYVLSAIFPYTRTFLAKCNDGAAQAVYVKTSRSQRPSPLPHMCRRFLRLHLQQLSPTTHYRPRPRRASIRNGLKLVLIWLECRPDLCYFVRTHTLACSCHFRKLDVAQTPPRERSPKRHLRGRQSLTPLSATQLKIDDVQSETDHRRAPTLMDDEPHSARRISRRPSATGESLPVVEHWGWPFRGFLKCTRIGNETTYNLEFQLPNISEQLNPPIAPEALGIGSGKESSARVATCHKARAQSKESLAALPQTRRLPRTTQEDAKIVEIRDDGCSWDGIQAALLRQTKGPTNPGSLFYEAQRVALQRVMPPTA